MKKTLFIIGLCAVFLSMPTLLAFPTTNKPSLLFTPQKMSDGTFAGGLGRGHWGNGKFNIDTVYAYMSGLYSSSVYIKISGDIIKNYEKIGEISAFIIYKIIFGYTKNVLGLRTTMFGYIMRNQNNQFVGRIMSINIPASHIWGYLIPNK
jgi:hypothetical protein